MALSLSQESGVVLLGCVPPGQAWDSEPQLTGQLRGPRGSDNLGVMAWVSQYRLLAGDPAWRRQRPGLPLGVCRIPKGREAQAKHW